MLSHGATERAAWGVGQQALGAGFALQLQQTHGGAGRFGAWFAQRTNAQIDKTACTTQLFDDRLAFLQIVFADVADHGVVVVWLFHIGLQRSRATGRCRWRSGGGGTASQQSSQGSGVDPGFHGGCSFKEGQRSGCRKRFCCFLTEHILFASLPENGWCCASTMTEWRKISTYVSVEPAWWA